MRVVWLPEAARNLDGQIDFVAERNPVAAIELGDRISEDVSRLVEFPHSAPLGRVAGTRGSSPARR